MWQLNSFTSTLARQKILITASNDGQYSMICFSNIFKVRKAPQKSVKVLTIQDCIQLKLCKYETRFKFCIQCFKILASAQLCDTLYLNIIENNKSAAEYAHRCVYYLSSSTFHRESVCLLSESKSQITAVSPSILTRYECKTRCLEQYPTLVGTTDGIKHHPHAP